MAALGRRQIAIVVRVFVATIAISLSACGGKSQETSEEGRLHALAEKYPRIDPGNIVVPPASELTRPDFDIGRHCLSQEEAGNGSFEQCLEVLGRELIARGGPR